MSPADGVTVQAYPLVLHIANNTQADLLTNVDGALTSRNSSSTLIALPFVSPDDHAICVIAGDLSQKAGAQAGIHVVVQAP